MGRRLPINGRGKPGRAGALRILVATDFATLNPANPFTYSLVRSLAERSDVDFVSYGVDVLKWRVGVDVIHFNWPEALFKWSTPTQTEFAAMEACLDERAREASFVTTVHNLNPHPRVEDGERVYRLVYSRSKLFIHLSTASRDAFFGKYRAEPWCRSARHVVVPHGDYAYYRGLPSDPAMVRRARHGDYDGPLILVFGAIRSPAEERLAREAFGESGVQARLVFAGAPDKRLVPAETIAIWRREPDGDIVRIHRRIEDTQVAPLVSSSKFVFIVRQDRINSGVIPLAYTFDRPVIAPDNEGLASATSRVGALTYAAGDVGAAASAIARAMQMSDAEYRRMQARIGAYRDRHMGWPDIAARHIQLYASLSVRS